MAELTLKKLLETKKWLEENEKNRTKYFIDDKEYIILKPRKVAQ